MIAWTHPRYQVCHQEPLKHFVWNLGAIKVVGAYEQVFVCQRTIYKCLSTWEPSSLCARYFATFRIMLLLWNCCCCMFPQRREGGKQRGNFVIQRELFGAMCGRVDRVGISASARVGEWEEERRARMADSAVSQMKCTAPKPNRFRKQKPFPKSHSRTHHL